MSKRASSEHKIADPAERVVHAQPPISTPPGVYLAETILPQWGMTNTADLARRLGVNRVGLHGVLTGKYDVSRELAYKLGALLRDEVADLLIAYQHAYDLASEAEKRAAYKAVIERVAPPE